jgi:hypothetical protein
MESRSRTYRANDPDETDEGYEGHEADDAHETNATDEAHEASDTNGGMVALELLGVAKPMSPTA